MSATNDLVPILKKLRLSGVLQGLDVRTRQAVDEEIGHVAFLYRLLVDKVERRELKQLFHLSRTSFEHARTIEGFARRSGSRTTAVPRLRRAGLDDRYRA